MSITRCGSARSSVISTISHSPIAAQLAYWQEALAGMPERLVLPTDRPYPPVADYRGASVAVEWPAELQQRVARVAREHHATSFMVIQAALAVLLAKLCASSEVAVGFPIAGRRDPALDESGRVFRQHLGAADRRGARIPRLPSCWPRCKSAAWLPLSIKMCLLRCWWSGCNPTRSLAHHPLVQVVLAWQNLPGHDHGPRRRVGVGGSAGHAAAGRHPDRPHGPDVFVGRALHRGR